MSSRSPKKPKYKLDPKKFMAQEERVKEKDRDWSESELFNEIMRSKSRHRH